MSTAVAGEFEDDELYGSGYSNKFDDEDNDWENPIECPECDGRGWVFDENGDTIDCPNECNCGRL